MKKLLYLYNDGYRAFPHLGRGGLGYKPPIKIIGDGLHFVFNPETNEYDTIDDLDNSDTNIYNIDYGTHEHGDAMIKRSENLLLEKERKKEARKTQEEGNKLITDLEKQVEELDYETDSDDEYIDEEEVLTPEEIEELIQDTTATSMTGLMNSLNTNAGRKVIENRGVAFEHYTENSINSQKILKSITQTDENFKDIDKNPNYFNNNDMTNPIMLYGRPLHKMALYDFWNNECIIELKWNEYDNVCEVQLGKFIGNPYAYPLFVETSVGSGILTLYNIWNENLNKYVYPTNNKSLFLYTRLNDGLYSLDITGLVNGKNPLIAVNYPSKKMKQKTPDGRQFYVMNETSLNETFETTYRTEYGKKTKWYKISKAQMKKL